MAIFNDQANTVSHQPFVRRRPMGGPQVNAPTGEEGNPEIPRELPNEGPGVPVPTPAPPIVSRRTTGTGMGTGTEGGAQGAPPLPMAPSPVAMQPPAPFTPMAYGNRPTMGRMLFGKAGGLLGGGLGVPGAMSDEGLDVDALLEMLRLAGSEE